MPDFDFDAFNHDNVEGEGGEGINNEHVEPAHTEAEATVQMETEAEAPVQPAPAAEVIPPASNNTEEVDKW